MHSVRLVRRSLFQTLLGASLWGLSGNAAQVLFHDYNFPVVGLVATRLLVSGTVLVLILRPGVPSGSWGRLIALAVIGYAGSQFFYLVAIQFSNAATATLLQFLFLPMVASYEAITGLFHWSRRWTLTIVLAVGGTLLLVIGESFRLLITPEALVAGLLAAFSGAYYTLGSKEYVRKHGSWWITCHGFLISGIFALPLGIMSFWNYQLPGALADSLRLSFLLVFVILAGTLLAFGLYISGLRCLTATETGVASSLEPIVSASAAYFFLGVVLTPTQYLGGTLIILAVIIVGMKAGRAVDNHQK